MTRVRIYITAWCGYCKRARMLLERRGIAYEAIDCDGDANLRSWLVEVTGRRTVPQIFIDGVSIGGCSELEAMDAPGHLADLL